MSFTVHDAAMKAHKSDAVCVCGNRPRKRRFLFSDFRAQIVSAFL
jgi:hypothetical protein